MTISGARLFGGGAKVDTVWLAGAGTEAKVLSQSNDAIVVEAPDKYNVSGQLKLVSDTGAYITKDKAFAFGSIGVIAKVDPPSGQWGAKVTVSGTNLRGHGGKVTKVRSR